VGGKVVGGWVTWLKERDESAKWTQRESCHKAKWHGAGALGDTIH